MFEGLPTLAAGVGLEASVESVLHDGDELLVAKLPVTVIVKDVKHSIHDVRTEAVPRADADGTVKLVLRDGLLGQCIHPHGDAKIIQSVQKLTERFELVKSDALFLRQFVDKAFQVHLVLVGLKVGVAEEDFGEVQLGYRFQPLRELIEFNLKHFRLQVFHEHLEVFKPKILFALPAKEVHEQRRVDLVALLQRVIQGARLRLLVVVCSSCISSL